MTYETFQYLPLLNNVTIIGNKRFEDYGVVPLSSDEITEVILEVFGYML